MSEQKFVNTNTQSWQNLEQFLGTQILPLAEPVPQGSIHRLRMKQGTVIPVHYHPGDEYVYVLEGIIETDGRECQAGTFWFIPANSELPNTDTLRGTVWASKIIGNSNNS